MQIDVLTLFPQMLESPFSAGILQRAVASKLITISLHNFRDYAHDRHHTVDDYAYGGGAGMVLKPEPIFEATEAIISRVRQEGWTGEVPVILLTPQGRLFSQKIVEELVRYRHMILICGQYEGFDERTREHLATDEISIGDYVLSSGEIAVMVVINAVARLVPGVLGSEESAQEDSFSRGLLEYPQYTRPPDFRGWKVPEVLLSGNHAEIAKWRRKQRVLRTLKRRPELLQHADLTEEEKRFIASLLPGDIPDRQNTG